MDSTQLLKGVLDLAVLAVVSTEDGYGYDVVRRLRAAGLDDVPVVVGGIVPPDDAEQLRAEGVAAVFTPKDYGLTEIMRRVVEEIRAARGLPPLVG